LGTTWGLLRPRRLHKAHMKAARPSKLAGARHCHWQQQPKANTPGVGRCGWKVLAHSHREAQLVGKGLEEEGLAQTAEGRAKSTK
jgi:hypothetical protein